MSKHTNCKLQCTARVISLVNVHIHHRLTKNVALMIHGFLQERCIRHRHARCTLFLHRPCRSGAARRPLELAASSQLINCIVLKLLNPTPTVTLAHTTTLILNLTLTPRLTLSLSLRLGPACLCDERKAKALATPPSSGECGSRSC